MNDTVKAFGRFLLGAALTVALYAIKAIDEDKKIKKEVSAQVDKKIAEIETEEDD